MFLFCFNNIYDCIYNNLSMKYNKLEKQNLRKKKTEKAVLPKIKKESKKIYPPILTGFLPSCGCVNTTVRMHHMDANKMHREKAWWKLHKNATSYSEQTVETTPMKQQLYSYLPPISKSILVRWTRHARHCWRSKDELMCCSSMDPYRVGRPARTYWHRHCADTRYSLEDLPGAIYDRDGWSVRSE